FERVRIAHDRDQHVRLRGSFARISGQLRSAANQTVRLRLRTVPDHQRKPRVQQVLRHRLPHQSQSDESNRGFHPRLLKTMYLDLDERKLDSVAERIDPLGADAHAIAEPENLPLGAAPSAIRLGYNGVVAFAIDAPLAGRFLEPVDADQPFDENLG